MKAGSLIDINFDNCVANFSNDIYRWVLQLKEFFSWCVCQVLLLAT